MRYVAASRSANMTIKIHSAYAQPHEPMNPSPVRIIYFPGGEPHVAVDTRAIEGQYVWIDARVRGMDDMGALMLAVDAVKRCRPQRLGLFLPYFLGARQDRVQRGMALTVRVFADLVNSWNLDLVVIVDPHSDVTPALLNNCEVITQAQLVDAWFPRELEGYDGVISPDAGAEKKSCSAAKVLGISEIVQCRKNRDQETGKLSGFAAGPLPKVGKYIVIDDICDGGGTFLGLADELGKDPNWAGSTLDLLVTHGIFSAGFMHLLEHYRRIYTTDSWFAAELEPDSAVRVIDLYPAALAAMRRIGK